MCSNFCVCGADSGHDSEERSRCTEVKELCSPEKEITSQILPTIKQESDPAAGTSDTTNPETEVRFFSITAEPFSILYYTECILFKASPFCNKSCVTFRAISL